MEIVSLAGVGEWAKSHTAHIGTLILYLPPGGRLPGKPLTYLAPPERHCTSSLHYGLEFCPFSLGAEFSPYGPEDKGRATLWGERSFRGKRIIVKDLVYNLKSCERQPGTIKLV